LSPRESTQSFKLAVLVLTPLIRLRNDMVRLTHNQLMKLAREKAMIKKIQAKVQKFKGKGKLKVKWNSINKDPRQELMGEYEHHTNRINLLLESIEKYQITYLEWNKDIPENFEEMRIELVDMWKEEIKILFRWWINDEVKIRNNDVYTS